MKPSFILNPRVYGGSVALHLIVVNDNGVKLGVIASEHPTGLSAEALAELHSFEQKAVIERVKEEIAAGNIDKAFVHDMCNRDKDEEFANVVPLFQYVPTDNGEVQCRERDRVNALLRGAQA